ncbi:hypothetical protein FUA23_17195 [Neolewinella aurantiaca]|uniref:Uncharacterized protein n=1 Tax=Neolewinella aurantiaca TaxID=2602767 RepID=A0A5C7FQX8_9BACT|nr:hypothetical protein [Neolewinella aurantiaca]TXF87795.1 hypothetical protein FUA23_17195 [Neolewinella aurantiaca]
MGLTLHHSGRLTSPEHVPELIHEVADICESAGWNYQIVDRVLHGVPEDYLRLIDEQATEFRAQGISFQVHEKAESTMLCFGPDGRTLSPMALFRPDLTDWSDDMLAHYSFTKTQLAGAEGHIVLCRILKYLFGKYFSEVEVNDEGEYYHTGDRELLEKQFAAYDEALSKITTVLSNANLEKATTIPELIAMIKAALPDAEIRLVSDEEE